MSVDMPDPDVDFDELNRSDDVFFGQCVFCNERAVQSGLIGNYIVFTCERHGYLYFTYQPSQREDSDG